jgi:subtilisin-like proprotein convertase family protein
MRTKLNLLMLAVAALLILTAGMARATFYTYDYTSGFAATNVPDGNPAGWSDSRSIGGIPGALTDGTTSEITDVNVRVNLTGGYNGDLYGYLQLHDENNVTVLTVLLNRVGTGSGSQPQFSFGYATAGMNVTFDDGASGNGNIHTNMSPISGQAYQPDSGAGSLADFNGKSANGTWTLFLADLSGGNVTTVGGWGLDINVVPEPVTWAMIIFGLVIGLVQMVRWQQRRQTRV